jgi:hypothetical protein
MAFSGEGPERIEHRIRRRVKREQEEVGLYARNRTRIWNEDRRAAAVLTA